MVDDRSAPQASLAKITRPRYARVLARPRLFRLLEDQRQRLIWLSAPPGAGKTALISNYLDTRQLPHLWYQLDRGDGDLPTFFHYLGLAATSTLQFDRKLLPQLRAEFNPDVSVFARRYFEALAARAKQPLVIVFDDYHEVATSAALHTALREGIAALPGNFVTVVLSRGGPPAELARMRLNEQLLLLDWEQLRLNVEEVSDLVHLISGEKGAAVPVEELCEKTQGWAGGLVFLLQQQKVDESKRPLQGATHQVLFDYFAGEIFATLDAETQRVLAASALLRQMTVRSVVELTGATAAGELLQNLNQRNYFTLKREHIEPIYEYHPLFREFLLARAEQMFESAPLNQLRCKAAALLEADGQVEEAVELLQAADDAQSLARLITAHAAAFIFEQGRYKVIEGWLRHLPHQMTCADPWLLYWNGICRLPYDPSLARVHLEQAYLHFKSSGDLLGQCRAWCAIVDSMVFEWSDFKPLDRWIDEMDQLLRTQPQLPGEVEASIACGMFLALMYRHPEHADLPSWEQRVQHIIFYGADAQLRTKVGNHMLLYYSWWVGDLAKAELLVNTLRPQMEESPCPLTQVTWQVMATGYYLTFTAAEECLPHVERGLQIAREAGIHGWDMLLAVQGVVASLTVGNVELSTRYLRCMEARLSASSLMDKATYYYSSAVLLVERGSLLSALESAGIAVGMAEEAGAPFWEALIRLVLGTVLVRTGRNAEGRALIDRSLTEARDMRSPMLEYLACMAEAMIALQSEDGVQAALEFLRKGLAIAARHRWHKFLSWSTESMTSLYALALERDIEVEYVCSVIRKRGLPPPEQAASLDSWPWPLKIHTLGGFRILKEGEPLRFSGKSPRKPLELLKALVAFGGSDVNQSTLIDALWPELEGDNAQRAFETALYRLRKLLGDDMAILLKSGKVTLETSRVWVDALAIEDLVQQQFDSSILASESDPQRLDQLATRLLAAYSGHFLPEESGAWALARRERLSNRVVTVLQEIGRRLEMCQAWNAAIRCYQRTVEIEPVMENLWYRLMLCYRHQGEPLEALAVYARCRRILAGLGITPSAEMELLRSALGSRGAESKPLAIVRSGHARLRP
jgi:ATP/maltotriose-dependent transcriptional regulator MalT/DNA-binding SARP family transcriptional activator